MSSMIGSMPVAQVMGYSSTSTLLAFLVLVGVIGAGITAYYQLKREDAEDLTQETFLRAWRQCKRLRDERAVGVWLFRITTNLWRDQMRRQRSPVARADLLTGEELGRTQLAEQLAADRESLGRALEAMAALPPRQREVLYLSACENLSTAQVAENWVANEKVGPPGAEEKTQAANRAGGTPCRPNPQNSPTPMLNSIRFGVMLRALSAFVET